jgi:DinB superfamily
MQPTSSVFPNATRVVSAAVVAMVVCTPSLKAQYLGGGTKTNAEVQIADLEDMRGKFVALADAFPEALYDWRPMDDVRSVRDVLALIIAEANLFPTMWSAPKPSWVAEGGFGSELQRVGALSKAETLTELQRALDHILDFSKNLSDMDRGRQVGFFGLTVDLTTALTLAQTDMHEHLGQAIAYARVNKIVPPWSRTQG